jgi:hypothetical protein
LLLAHHAPQTLTHPLGQATNHSVFFGEDYPTKEHRIYYFLTKINI